MINLYDLLEAATGQLFGDAVVKYFTDFCYDARHVKPGQLYAALRTERGDGHQYIEEAIANGATGIICTQPPETTRQRVTCLVVKDVQGALIDWAAYVLKQYGTTVIGVAGGPGSAVTREAIAHVLRKQYRVYNSGACYRGRSALPLALSGLDRTHQIAVLEVESDHPGDMADIIDVIQPIVSVVTAVPGAQAHECRTMIEKLPEDGLAVLNFDDADARAIMRIAPAPAVTFGMDAGGAAYGADLLAYNVRFNYYRTSFDLRHARQRHVGRWVRLLGPQQLYGVLAALLVGVAYDVPLEEGMAALSEMTALPGRLRLLEGLENSLIIDDTHDATIASTLGVLNWLEQVREPDRRVVFIMGDVAPPGSAHPYVDGLGARVAEVADTFITQGRMAAQVGRAAIEHNMPREKVRVTFSHADAITCAREGLGSDDLLLVKGASYTRMERVLRGLLLHPADTGLLVKDRPDVEAVRLDITRAAHRAWVEVDLSAVVNNVRKVKSIIGDAVTLMAVVRTNAYGHGAVEVGATAVLNGADYLGVGSLAEGIALRKAGVDAPILILSYTPGRQARQVIRHDLSATLFDLDTVEAFAAAAVALNTKVRVHYRIDTGQGRLGLGVKEVSQFFRRVVNLAGLEGEGIYTQLPGDPARAQAALRAFRQVFNSLKASGIKFRYIHAADTAATLTLPKSRLSMVRVGSGIYGINSSPQVPLPAGFRPVMCWKTRIAQVKVLPKGSTIGMDGSYQAEADEMIAVIPVGYADGLKPGWSDVLVHGKRVPLLGSIGVNHTTLGIQGRPDIGVGDEVVLLGRQGDAAITVEAIADALGIATYAVVTGVLAHTTGGRVITAQS